MFVGAHGRRGRSERQRECTDSRIISTERHSDRNTALLLTLADTWARVSGPRGLSP